MREPIILKGYTGPWEMVIGLEIHAQVKGMSKLFSGSSTELGADPNTQVSFVTRTYPNTSATTTNFSISSSTTKKDTRLRARSIAMKVANTASNEDWKLGTFRLDIHPGGRR